MEKTIIGHNGQRPKDIYLNEKKIITSLGISDKNLIVTLKNEAAAKSIIKRIEKGEYKYE